MAWAWGRKPIAFVGDLDVEDADFTLRADRLIVRSSEIAFHLSGRDEYGEFHIDGVAPLSKDGGFSSPELRLVYPGYEGRDHANILFNRVHMSPKSRRCEIEGVWLQYGDTWKFSGNLNCYAEP